jgi:hypothetical protein
MSKVIQGKVTKVASTGGFIINDNGKWLNQARGSTYTVPNRYEQVEVEINDKGFVTSVLVLNKYPKVEKVDPDKPIETKPKSDDIINPLPSESLIIIREVAIKSACDLYKIDAHVPDEIRLEVQKEILVFAKEIEKFIMRKLDS